MLRTVFALSTAPARSALAVIRISGPQASSALCLAPGPAISPFKATFRPLIDPTSHLVLDHAVVLYFPKPRSFTLEDTVELQVHGSLAVIRKLLTLLGKMQGFYPAEPGEFTKQALLNGRFDALQVEALSDLIRAETDWQLNQAVAHLEGAAGKVYTRWRELLLRTLAMCEAWIDFEEPGEDEHLESKISTAIETVLREVEQHLAAAYLSRPLAVALLGPPNSGKSSLLNALAREEIAIVAPTPGTTRDINRATLDLSGLPVTFYDTAGLRKTQDPVELEGQRRALQTQQAALIRLCVLDKTECRVDGDAYRWPEGLVMERPDLVLVNKVDLQPGNRAKYVDFRGEKVDCMHISCKTKEGLTSLLAFISTRISQDRPPEGTVLISRERHKVHIEALQGRLQSALNDSKSFDMKSEELREAVKCIGRVAGRVDAEEVLDKVFQEFCIGK